MQIDSKGTIAGIPSIQLRKFLRAYSRISFSATSLSHFFDLKLKDAKKIIIKLKTLGYIEPATDEPRSRWECTIKGLALMQASAAKPLIRTSADKMLKEFLERVKTVNKNPIYIYKVRLAVLFGSYLSTKERISDIDIGLDLVPKISDPKKFNELRQKKIQEALRGGRRFRNISEEAYWPLTEVWQFLRSRSRSLSFVSYADHKEIIEQANHMIFFHDSKKAALL